MPVPIVLGQQQAFGSVGSGYGAEQTTVTTANARTALPEGWWMGFNGAHNTLQYTPDGGSTFRTLAAVSVGWGAIWSDGFNVSILNDATGGTAATYVQIKGM
jgi:hypothetical protein